MVHLRHTEQTALERLGRVAVAVLDESREFIEGDVPAGVRVGGGKRLRRRGVVGLDTCVEIKCRGAHAIDASFPHCD